MCRRLTHVVPFSCTVRPFGQCEVPPPRVTYVLLFRRKPTGHAAIVPPPAPPPPPPPPPLLLSPAFWSDRARFAAPPVFAAPLKPIPRGWVYSVGPTDFCLLTPKPWKTPVGPAVTSPVTALRRLNPTRYLPRSTRPFRFTILALTIPVLQLRRDLFGFVQHLETDVCDFQLQ